MMASPIGLGGAAAFINPLSGPVTGFYCMTLEKSDWQKRDFFQGFYFGQIGF